MTALWIELTRHHAALDPHFALRAGRRRRGAPPARGAAARSRHRDLRRRRARAPRRVRDRLRAPRAADPPRDVPRRDHRSLRRARAPPPRLRARARGGGDALGERARRRARRGARLAAQPRGAGVLARGGLRRAHGRAAPSAVDVDSTRELRHAARIRRREHPPARARAERAPRQGRARGVRDAVGARPPALLPEGHPDPGRRGEAEGAPAQRDDRHRHRERRADAPALDRARTSSTSRPTRRSTTRRPRASRSCASAGATR